MMNIKSKKQPLNIRKTIRLTQQEFIKLDSKAKELGMPFTTYAHDKLVAGHERTTYAKRIMCKTIIMAQKHIDQFYELLESAESDYVSKENILNLLEDARKECTDLCNFL